MKRWTAFALSVDGLALAWLLTLPVTARPLLSSKTHLIHVAAERQGPLADHRDGGSEQMHAEGRAKGAGSRAPSPTR